MPPECHKIVWLGKGLKDNLAPTPLAPGTDTFH